MNAMDDIKAFVTSYTTFDKPIPYNGLLVYPIKLEDCFQFLESLDLLTYDKNTIPNPQVIKMSYLQFIFVLMIEESAWKYKLINILSLCLKAERTEPLKDFPDLEILVQDLNDGRSMYFINGYNIKFESINNNQIYLYVNDIKINSKEFDELKSIILFQNINDYDGVEMSEDFKKVIDDYYSLKNKGMKSLTLEDKIDAVMSQTGYTKQYLQLMPLRSFDRLFNKVVDHTEYIVNRIGEIHDRVKESPEHWVYKKDKNKYSNIFSSVEAYQTELGSGAVKG